VIYLFLALAAGLFFTAWVNRRDRAATIFFLACALLNVGAAVKSVITTDVYAYQLHPAGEADATDALRADRR